MLHCNSPNYGGYSHHEASPASQSSTQEQCRRAHRQNAMITSSRATA